MSQSTRPLRAVNPAAHPNPRPDCCQRLDDRGRAVVEVAGTFWHVEMLLGKLPGQHGVFSVGYRLARGVSALDAVLCPQRRVFDIDATGRCSACGPQHAQDCPHLAALRALLDLCAVGAAERKGA